MIRKMMPMLMRKKLLTKKKMALMVVHMNIRFGDEHFRMTKSREMKG